MAKLLFTTQLRESFVLRIWYEPSSRGRDSLRGEITHVRSTSSIYFDSLDDLAEAVRDLMKSQPELPEEKKV